MMEEGGGSDATSATSIMSHVTVGDAEAGGVARRSSRAARRQTDKTKKGTRGRGWIQREDKGE